MMCTATLGPGNSGCQSKDRDQKLKKKKISLLACAEGWSDINKPSVLRTEPGLQAALEPKRWTHVVQKGVGGVVICAEPDSGTYRRGV